MSEVNYTSLINILRGVYMYNLSILLVEDDDRIRDIVTRYLEHEGFSIYGAPDARHAFELLEERDYHMVLLDVMLPDSDGWVVLRRIRESNEVPVIMLTARSEDEDKLLGFELGADDYITKPFSNKLLLARIKAVLKRNQIATVSDTIEIKNLVINKTSRQVYVSDKLIDLTPIEFSLLLYFVDNMNIALTRNQILDSVWGFDYYGDHRTVDTHVKRLRHKLLDASDCITTVRGHGYRMVKDEG